MTAAAPSPPAPPPPPPPPRAMTPWLFVVLGVVVFSGALFGYDQGVISGALHGIKSSLSLSPLLIEVVTSWVTLGALLGSLAGGELADRFGRKHAIIIAAVFFTAGSLVEALTPGTVILVCGRLIVGVGVGVAAVAAPLYASELAPAAMRGRFVSAYQLAIACGIFIAYLVDGWLSSSDAWRWMLGASAVPGLLLLAVALLAPESPRWLMKMKRRPQALIEVGKVHPGTNAKPQVDAIALALGKNSGAASWGEVFHKQWRRPLIVGLGLAVLQQFTGINAIIYYANQIFAAAGFATQASQAAVTIWAVGAVNVAATLVALAFIDRLGRRKLLLAGLVGMTLSMIVIGIAFEFVVAPVAGVPHTALGIGGTVAIAAVVAFIISFGFSVGPVVWTVINEIFPGHIRGRAVAIATAVNWAAAFLVSQGFLSLLGAVGPSFAFWLFALFCAIGGVWTYRAVSETKGKSLEEIQEIWQPKGD